MNLKIGTLEGLVVLHHGIPHRRLVLEGHVGKIVSTNLQEGNLATHFKVIEQDLLGDLSGNVAHDDGVIGLVVVR